MIYRSDDAFICICIYIHVCISVNSIRLHGIYCTSVSLILKCLVAYDKPHGWSHDDVIKWKHFPRYWPFVRRIHQSQVNSPHKGQCRGAVTFSLICVWINDWVNNREAGNLRRHNGHYDVIVMSSVFMDVFFIASASYSFIDVLFLGK